MSAATEKLLEGATEISRKQLALHGTLEGLAMFPLPPVETLKAENYQWWRSAQM